MGDKAVEGESAVAEKGRNLRAVIWFVALTNAIAWPYMYLTLSHHCPSLEELTEETTRRFFSPLHLLLGLPVNWVPGICALLVTRFLLHEDWHTMTLNRVGLKRYYIWAWFLCPAITLIIVWLSVLLGRASFDPSMIMAQAAGYEFTSGADFRGQFLVQLLPAALVLPALWALIGVGEEIGWRGFLLPRLMKAGLGQWQALILSGVIWGFWHAPLPLSGCFFPGHWLLGLIMIVVGLTLLGVVFGWLRLASGSVWVPAVAHSAFDVISRREAFLLAPGYNYYLVGSDGSLLGWAVYSIFIAWLAWTGRLPVGRGKCQNWWGRCVSPRASMQFDAPPKGAYVARRSGGNRKAYPDRHGYTERLGKWSDPFFRPEETVTANSWSLNGFCPVRQARLSRCIRSNRLRRMGRPLRGNGRRRPRSPSLGRSQRHPLGRY